MLLLTVPEAHAGARLDAVLHDLVSGLSRYDARRIAELGAVSRGGVRATAAERVRAGDVVKVPDSTLATSLALGLPVVHADRDVLVIYKLPGLAAHPGTLVTDSVAARVSASLIGAGLAQRLDRGASGLMLVGKHKEALRALGLAMEADAITREYLAIGAGAATFATRTIDLPLRVTDEPRGDRPKVVVDREAGQAAITYLETLATRGTTTLFRVRLGSGRTHQIRAHLAAIGHPLLGDPRYGDASANQKAHATHGVTRPLLHATRLAFQQPSSATQVVAEAWNEPDFARLFPELRA